MRSFSGFYFYLRLMFHHISVVFRTVLNRDKWTALGVTFFISALIITITRPYRKSYMNIIDTLLLANITLLWLSNSNTFLMIYPVTPTSYLALYLLLVTPTVGLIFLIFLKIVHRKTCFQKLKTHISICCNNLRVQVQKFV